MQIRNMMANFNAYNSNLSLEVFSSNESLKSQHKFLVCKFGYSYHFQNMICEAELIMWAYKHIYKHLRCVHVWLTGTAVHSAAAFSSQQ